MPTGYCTLDDVRRALQETLESFNTGIWSEQAIVIDAIASQTKWLERATERHWYESGGITEDDAGLVPTGPLTRDDEHDIPTHGGFVHGASETRRRYAANSDALLEAGPRFDRRREHYRRRKREIRLAFGDTYDLTLHQDIPAYTRIRFDRKDVQAVNTLNVVNEDGGFDDWTATKTGGVGNANRGDDWWVRINNDGWSELYLNVHSMDDDIASFSSAVYVDFDFGHDGLPRYVRRAVAFRAVAQLLMDNHVEVRRPDDEPIDVASKVETLERQANELLEHDLVADDNDET